ncbi:hypothetical protein TBLA_0C02060 [Henningerozyma blattae CBS 6284]|uniref:Oleate activated transcription factor 3 n=1 Tax=Henningerozyma blattae (strain ATCC 34711 / CBS 6284 / DSM 70876 / NBRC 10599 / NRRL Y-10934 / UCD 77-7) TaxID=1071380 RepID=I2H0W6_HENB6|nr:hypothetical protein TBLA_0C02060 [Tetrapisispora blattae CBS 6284]CCH60018.1 hypothetical protein TBLA_0C02060 [Tetrapisispora blattae CBS 6284]
MDTPISFPPIKRRARLTVVCTNCKKRKSKCDRAKPCSHCIRLGIANECTYLNAVTPRRKHGGNGGGNGNNSGVTNSNSGITFGGTEMNNFLKIIPKEDCTIDNEVVGSGGTLDMGTINEEPLPPTNSYIPPPLNETPLNETPMNEVPEVSYKATVRSPSVFSNHPITFTPMDCSMTTLEENVVTESVLPTANHHEVDEIINLIPNKRYVTFKRSAISLVSLFSDTAIEQRDIYLKCMIAFRSIAIKMTTSKLKPSGLEYNQNCLPKSFVPLSVFDADGDPLSPETFVKQQKSIHKKLLDKFGEYRKNSNFKIIEGVKLPGVHLPSKYLFMNEILPIFEKHVYNMVPIFNLHALRWDIVKFYEGLEKNGGEMSLKQFDHLVYCVVLLICKLSQLSIHFCKSNEANVQSRILQLDSSKYIAIVNHYLSDLKMLRKCTLIQLQTMILLRFYYWCAPEDGDGAELQQSQILMGAIIASCREIGASWGVLIDRENYYLKIQHQVRPPLSIMNQGDYMRLFQKIWSFVLFWDRKMFLINGQECGVEKSFVYNYERYVRQDEENNRVSWYEKMVNIDLLMMKMNDSIHDMPSRVNVRQVQGYLKKLNSQFQFLSMKWNHETHLNLEFQLMLGLFNVSLLHCQMVHYETSVHTVCYYDSSQKLWDELVSLSSLCYDYFYGEGKRFLNPYTRFYTNKIIGIVSDKVCVLLPTFILRSNLIMEPTRQEQEYSRRQAMIQFLYNVSSMYFNELGSDYYRCFKKMFTAKISYKILNRPSSRNTWATILEFLVYEIETSDDKIIYKSEGARLSVKLPEIRQLVEAIASHRARGNVAVDPVYLWKHELVKRGDVLDDCVIDIHERELQELFAEQPRHLRHGNMFSRFYDYTSGQLAKSIDAIGVASGTAETQTEAQTLPTESEMQGRFQAEAEAEAGVQADGQTDGHTDGHTGQAESSSHAVPGQAQQGQPANQQASPFDSLELLQDMFEPLDFLSFF